MSNLKPCPFCGKDPNQATAELGDRPCFYYECKNPKCGATEMGWHDTEQEAIAAWNTRPIEDALRKEIAQLKKDKLEFNAQCFHKDETISILKNRISHLDSTARSLVEQMNEMALKPNQAIIERHEYDHDNPETYPGKRGFYLCESASGKIELFWSPLGQEWYITEVHDKVYNHFQINAYYTWVKAPKGVKHEKQ